MTSQQSQDDKSTSSSLSEYSDKSIKKGLCRISWILAPQGRMVNSIVLFGIFGAVVNFPEGYSNSYPNTSYMSFKTMINGSYIKRGMENGLSPSLFTWLWSLTLNIWFIGYFIGTLMTPFLTEKYGRRKALLFSSVIATIGAIMGFLAVVLSIPELVLISRIVSSTSSGISFGCLILFLQETTATEYRGMTSFLSETTFIFCNVLGIAFGMNAVFGKNLPALTGIAILPAVIATIMCIPLKETPKFLLLNKKDRAKAMESLIYYQGHQDNLNEILDEMLLEVDDTDVREPILRSVVTVFTTPHLRTAYFIGCTALQIIVGIWPITYLSTDMLSTLFTEEISQLASLAIIGVNFIAGMCGMLLIEKVGRRTLVLWLGVLNTLSLALYVLFDRLAVTVPECRWGTIGALMMNGITYGVGLGPIAFFITSELVAQQYRSVVQSMVMATNTISNFAFSFATLPAFDAVKSWSFIPLFIIPSIFSIIFLYFNMPETKGREVHEIVDELVARKSSDTVSTKTRNMSCSTVSSAYTNTNTFKNSFTKKSGSEQLP